MAVGILAAFAGALAGALAALVVAYAWYRQVGQRRLEDRLAQAQDEFEKRVKQGVLAAGEELLPAFRQNVADGFRDAIRDLHPAGLAEDAARTVSGAADLLASGLGNLFGLKPRKP